ncbi:MAG: peptide deformylase [Candidatus Niyogibacteria bacterium]|nr:peptide deformylase [Candidatus Niyogibacteria bacterium]
MPKNKKIRPIIQDGDPVLRKTPPELPLPEITSRRIQDIIHEMSESLYSSANGIGIAAPQIGYSLPIFLISEEAMQKPGAPHNHEAGKRHWKHFVFINPKLIKSSQKKELLDEGCLSVDGVYGRVRRARQVTVEAYNEKGGKFRVGASGLYAQALQHEMDHLNGVLFIDKAEAVEPISKILPPAR